MDGLKHAYQEIIERLQQVAAVRRCSRRATVAILVRDGDVYMHRGNGPVLGHTCTGLVGHCGCAHAEARLLLDAVVHHHTLSQSQLELWSYLSPCSSCANLIVLVQEVGLKIKSVTYVEELVHDQLGKRVLINAGIDVLKADRP